MYTPVIGVLGYVLSPDRDRVLLVHRSREGDLHAGKWNGLGGKLEPDEDIYACLVRELKEEAGIGVTAARLRGTVSWPGFADSGDWFGFIFVVDAFEGTPPPTNTDGELRWHRLDQLSKLPMWPGDRYFLPLVFGDGPTFHGVMPYAGGQPTGWSYSQA